MDLFMALHFVASLRSLNLLIRPLYLMIINTHFNSRKILTIERFRFPLQINSKLWLLGVNSVSLEASYNYFKPLHFQKVNLYYLHLVVPHYFNKDLGYDLFWFQFLQKDLIINLTCLLKGYLIYLDLHFTIAHLDHLHHH